MSDRPHIVFIFSDQHRADVIGACGDAVVRTPNLDRLARRGTTLENCYCGSPWCVPSRMSMLTGRLPGQTGVFTNSQTLASDQPTVAHGLAAAGYETVLCGRMHFLGFDQWHGYEKRLVGDLTATMPGAVSLDYGDLGVATGQSDRGARLAGPGRSFVMRYDEDVTNGAIQYLQERRDDRPLFLTVGHYGPHAPFVCPRDLFAYYWDRVTAPPAPAACYENHHPSLQRWMDRRGLRSLTPDEARIARVAYYGLVELMDRHAGRILASVEETLGLENTLIIYGSDHGEMMGEKGLFWKSSFFEGSARVPLILSQPGVVTEGQRLRAPTSLLDLAPTLLNLAGGPPLPDAYGRPFDHALLGNSDLDPDRAVVSMIVDGRKFPSAMIRWRQWKLIDHFGSETPQLFDLDRDPREDQDLASEPATADVRRELQARLDRHWSPKAALEQVHHDNERFELIKRANAASRPTPPAQWVPAGEMNEIESWP